MELGKNLCRNCNGNFCTLNNGEENLKNCVLNLIIYEDENKILFYNFPEKRIFKISKSEGLKEIDFRTLIREIDIIATKPPEWKKLQILKLAKDLGFFGI